MIVRGDCVALMAELPEGSVDAIVTDPPYGLEFMGKEWDRLWTDHPEGQRGRINGQGGMDTFGKSPNYQGGIRAQKWHEAWTREALRVLKPGGHLLAFGGTRTYHRLACAIEDAGFEIRDCLAWLYGSGFPKSHNLNGDWEGWGTALKPAHEPVVLARKPLAGTVAANVLEHGTGALNVDGCRIGTDDDLNGGAYSGELRRRDEYASTDSVPGAIPLSRLNRGSGEYVQPAGRWPANVVLDEQAAGMLDEQTGDLHSQDPATRNSISPRSGVIGFADSGLHYADSGGASRFLYVAKASSAERSVGLPEGRNSHPTVKPIELMRWLVRLVTPPGGTVLDPFAGSGTTGCAAVLEDLNFVGMEREAEYVKIAEARIAWWSQHPDGLEIVKALEAERERKAHRDAGQLGMFDVEPVPSTGNGREGEPSAERRYTDSGGSNFAMKPGRRRS